MTRDTKIRVAVSHLHPSKRAARVMAILKGGDAALKKAFRVRFRRINPRLRRQQRCPSFYRKAS